jgi:hypothetical protein
MPNYTRNVVAIGSAGPNNKLSQAKGWNGLAAVLGSLITMTTIYFAARAINKRAA